jgi:hypothetical protein
MTTYYHWPHLSIPLVKPGHHYVTRALFDHLCSTPQVLIQGGEPSERIYAAAILPLVERKHWLLGMG